MAYLDRKALGHHGAGAPAAGQPAPGPLDPQPVSLSRSLEPCAGGTAEGTSRAESRRTGAARHPDHHQRNFGGIAQQRIAVIPGPREDACPGMTIVWRASAIIRA